MDKDKKWMKHLPKKRINEILQLKPTNVAFVVKQPSHISCSIDTQHSHGFGLAICSTLDKQKFSVRIGKLIASGRALNAIKKRKQMSNSIRVHNPDHSFPRNWKQSQIKHLKHIGSQFVFKEDFKTIGTH